jgi:tripartite-type tricarboxylate transporter receptor subunit TctC
MKTSFLRSNFAPAFAALLLGLGAVAAIAADDFPNKPVRIVVPAAPGGSLDVTTRLIAQKMTEKLGQPVIVDNRPGGDTLLGTRLAKDAPADGYTMLAQANGFTLLPYIKTDPGYDPVKDFTGLGIMTTGSMIMEVPASSRDQSVKDILDRGKAQKLSYGTGGQGTPQQVSAAMFIQAAGLANALEIPYKGAGPTLLDVVAGRLDFTFDAFPSSRGFLETGKLRPLAVTGPTRIAPLPNVPTLQELGYDVKYKVWLGLVVRSGTPPAAIQRLSEALKYAQANKELLERFRGEGSDPTFVSPEEMSGNLRKEFGDNAALAASLNFQKQ